MRQILKYTIFYSFWVIFFTLFIHTIYNLVTGNNVDNIIIAEWVYLVTCLIFIIVSLGQKLVITSPKIGRKILHETGTYFLDIRVEKVHFDVKITLFLYQDKLIYKRRVDQLFISDLDDESIKSQLSRSLSNIEKEFNIIKSIKDKKQATLNLKSLQNQRIDKMKSLF